MSLKIGKGGRPWGRYGIYADPKDGKTRLGTSLPYGQYSWGKKAVYVAVDPGASDLERSSILEEYRDNLVIASFESDTKDGKLVRPNVLEEAVEAATKDWRSVDSDIGTIIWDTMTTTSQDLLMAIAPMGLYGNNISLGIKGTASYIAQPQMGDFGAAQRSTMRIIDFLFAQPLNVVVLFHAILTDPADGEVVGGPATVGKAAIRPIAGLFDNLFHLGWDKTRVGTVTPPKYNKQRVVWTEAHGVWMAGMRSKHKSNPCPKVVLEENPVNFWHAIEGVKNGN